MIVMIGFKYKPLQRIKTDRLKYYLWDHPDRELVGYLLDGYTNRFKLGRTRRPKAKAHVKIPGKSKDTPMKHRNW